GQMLNHEGHSLWVHRPSNGELLAAPDVGWMEVNGCTLLTMDDCRNAMFATIDACPWLDFYLLTKRPQNVRSMWADSRRRPGPSEYRRCLDGEANINRRHNVHLLYSASDQKSLEEGIDSLLACRDLCQVLGL